MADNPTKKKESNTNAAESLRVQDLSQVVDRSTKTLHELDERLRTLRTELTDAIGRAGIPMPATGAGWPGSQAFGTPGSGYGSEAHPRAFGAQGHAAGPLGFGAQQGAGPRPGQGAPTQEPLHWAGTQPFNAPSQGFQFGLPSGILQASPYLVNVPFGAPSPVPQQLSPFQASGGPIASPFSNPFLQAGGPSAPWASMSGVPAWPPTGTSGLGVGSAGTLGTPGAAGGLGQGLARSTRDRAGQPPVNRQPAVDIVDEGSDYQLQMDMPGVGKENLDIMATDRAVIVTATAKPETGDGMLVLGERETVVYRRTIPLPTEIKTGDCKASLKNGVLTLTVPKKNPTAGPKHVDVAFG